MHNLLISRSTSCATTPKKKRASQNKSVWQNILPAKNKTQSLGQRGEQIAAEYLEHHGYEILHRGWRLHWGEIDLIALDGDEIVFVEVKTRSSRRFGSPFEALSTSKQLHLRRSVYFYLAKLSSRPKKFRIDVIALEVDVRRKTCRLRHRKAAVGG